jgi:hypothetical protein
MLRRSWNRRFRPYISLYIFAFLNLNFIAFFVIHYFNSSIIIRFSLLFNRKFNENEKCSKLQFHTSGGFFISISGEKKGKQYYYRDMKSENRKTKKGE